MKMNIATHNLPTKYSHWQDKRCCSKLKYHHGHLSKCWCTHVVAMNFSVKRTTKNYNHYTETFPKSECSTSWSSCHKKNDKATHPPCQCHTTHELGHQWGQCRIRMDSVVAPTIKSWPFIIFLSVWSFDGPHVTTQYLDEKVLQKQCASGCWGSRKTSTRHYVPRLKIVTTISNSSISCC